MVEGIRELLLCARTVGLVDAELAGFLAAAQRRFGDLSVAAQVLGSSRVARARGVMQRPEYVSTREAIRRATLDPSDESEALSALHHETLEQCTREWAEQVLRDLGFSPGRPREVSPYLLLEEARRAAMDARTTARAASLHLAQFDASLGAALTPPQREALGDAFREAHRHLLAEVERTSSELAMRLRQGAIPRSVLYAGYESLAETPLAEEALRWVAGQTPHQRPGDANEQQLAALAARAAATVAAKIFQRAPTVAEGLARLRNLLAPLDDDGSLRAELDHFSSTFEAVERGADPQLLAQALERSIARHPLSRALFIATFVGASARADADAERARLWGLLGALASMGANGLEVLEEVTTAVFLAGDLALVAGDASKATRMLELGRRLGSSLLVVNALTGLSVRASDPTPNAGTYLAMGGAAVSLVGNLMRATGAVEVSSGAGAALGIGQVALGSLLSVVGNGTAFAGDTLSGLIRAEGRGAEVRALLGQANTFLAQRGTPLVPEEVIAALGQPSVDTARLAPLRATPERLQSILSSFPELAVLPAPAIEELNDARTLVEPDAGDELAFFQRCRARFGNLATAASVLGDLRRAHEQRPSSASAGAPLGATAGGGDDTVSRSEALARDHRARRALRRAEWARSLRSVLGVEARGGRPAP